MSPEDILEDGRRAGVNGFVTIGTSLEDSQEALMFARNHKDVFCSIGIYPHENLDVPLGDVHSKLLDLYKNSKNKIVAIGECGIDKSDFDGARNLESQLELFKLQVGFAVEHDLPIIIHNRDGSEEIIRTLKKYSKYHGSRLKGVAHCFTQDWELAREYLDLGFYISFSGIITFPSAGEDLTHVVKKVPHNRYLIETDAPYLAPQGHRGEVNYPKYVKIVAEKVAELRNIPFSEVEKESVSNTQRIFSIKL